LLKGTNPARRGGGGKGGRNLAWDTEAYV